MHPYRLGCNKHLLQEKSQLPYYVMYRYAHLYKSYFLFPMIKLFAFYIPSDITQHLPSCSLAFVEHTIHTFIR